MEDLSLTPEFYQTAFQIICTMAIGTAVPSEPVINADPVMLQPHKIVEQLPTESDSVRFARQKAAEIGISLAEPLPEPDLESAKDVPGAQEIYSYGDSANQDLAPRPVTVKRGKAYKNIDLADCIEKSAREEGIDPLIVEIVIKHESAFDPQACSGVGASGLMQLMPETARDLGVTDLTDPEQNIAAGTKYLAQQYRHYANLKLALAAYNAGPGNVDYYGGVPPFEETQNYASSIASEYESRRGLRDVAQSTVSDAARAALEPDSAPASSAFVVQDPFAGRAE